MFSIIKQNDNVSPYIIEYIADTPEDIKKLPTTIANPGSTCLVASDSSVYILNNKREWVKLG
jgi:hypothetical protein